MEESKGPQACPQARPEGPQARQVATLIDTLSIENPFTCEQVSEGIAKWPTTLDDCVRRAAVFQSLQRAAKSSTPTTLEETDADLHLLGESVKALEPLLREATDVEKEGYSQVHFQGTPWSAINSIPFALVVLSFYKSYIVPACSIVLPLLSWILPYILLKVMYNVPITFSDYTTILWRMWNGEPMPRRPEDLLAPPAPAPPPDAATSLKQLVQHGWTLFTLGQTLWQPIQQAKHFMRLEADCISLGNTILDVKGGCSRLAERWARWLPGFLPSWIPLCPSTSREAFAFALESPFWLRHCFRAVSRFEILWRLANRGDVVPAEFVRSVKPVLVLKEFGDPQIPLEKRVISSVGFGGQAPLHSILTGPNRGGKSSCMRGILLNVLTTHAFGAAFAGKAQLSHFSWIADGMRLDDTPGSVSMFERELGFASTILRKRGESGNGLVVYDELFHSTNPPDAIRTSEAFCERFWKKENCVSVVSTHVYSLAKSAPSSVQKLCVAAWKQGDRFTFSYTIQQGICEVSSVDLLLGQFYIARPPRGNRARGNRE